MASKKDCVRIVKLITDANPGVKFSDGTPASWTIAFQDVPRLKLFLVVQDFVRAGTRFTPAVSEIWELLRKFDVNNSYWKPPHDQKDERCMWWMAINGVADPYEIPEKVIQEIYQ